MSNAIRDLMAKEVDRKQFILHMGSVALAVTGVAGLMRALTEINRPNRSVGYGASTYGSANGKDIKS